MSKRKEELASILANIGEMHSRQDEPWRARAYQNAADRVREVDEEGLREDPEQYDDIGEAIGYKIQEYWETGEIEKWEELREEADMDFDPAVLTQVEGLGTKTAQKLHDELGIQDLDDLEEACEEGEVEELDGFGSKTQENYLQEIEMVRKGVNERTEWEEADRLTSELRLRLQNLPETIRVEPAGSFRREEDTVGDVDILVASDDHEAVFDCAEEVASEVLMRGNTKMTLRIDTLQVDIRVVPEKSFGAALMYFTGSTGFNTEMRKWCKKHGLTLNEYGLYTFHREDSEMIKDERTASETEEEIFDALGLPFVEPQNRSEETMKELVNDAEEPPVLKKVNQ